MKVDDLEQRVLPEVGLAQGGGPLGLPPSGMFVPSRPLTSLEGPPRCPPRVPASASSADLQIHCHRLFCHIEVPLKQFTSPVSLSHIRTSLKSLLVKQAPDHGSSVLPLTSRVT